MSSKFVFIKAVGVLLLLCMVSMVAHAARISDITNTKHNLSMGSGGVEAQSESQLCVFCHTPHGANAQPQAPLWNRKLAGDTGYSPTYSMYNSSSMESSALAGGPPVEPSNSSKLCLSCHDGVIAIGAVNVLNGQGNQTIAMNGAGPGGVMPAGSVGVNSGSTRNLGVDLTNDHPISITYDTTLVNADGDMTDPLASPHVGVRTAGGVKPLIPLIPDPNDGNKPKLECISCHDPHVRDDSGADIKFLRLNRFQTNSAPAPLGANRLQVDFNESNDIICLACHNKEGWVDSAHANELVADEAYNATAAAARDFPAGIKVWQAACLNCHDTHTVAGSRRLLREGTDDTLVGGNVIKSGGGEPAIEETCYQCHANNLEQGYALNGVNLQVPNIKSEFARIFHMNITSGEQTGLGTERHSIGGEGSSEQSNGAGKDLVESQLKLGKGDISNRHVECTDCHNPHRVAKVRLASTDPGSPNAWDDEGTHDHWSAVEGRGAHDNLISGVLRGNWGIEPIYAGQAFFDEPIGYTVKKGTPPIGADLTNVNATYATREYQICFKCHSKYAYDNPMDVGYTTGLTPYGTNGMTQYTSNAREFQAPATHMGDGQNLGFEAGAEGSDFSCSDFGTCNFDWNNHRSWHPVMQPTGRTKANRGGMQSGSWEAPWDNNTGNQTMYCSDCHGQAITTQGTVDPDGQGTTDGTPWGPHGSDNPFILKGKYDYQTGTPCGGSCGNTPDTRMDQKTHDLCFKCHDYDNYANPDYVGRSGFRKAGSDNLHTKHASRLKRMKCMWCHVSTPHGWKNRNFLVNLNDIGPEVCNPICPTGFEAAINRGFEHRLDVNAGITQPLYLGPYYYNAILKLTRFSNSGDWDPKNCGSRNYADTEGSGQSWMTGTCNNLP